MSYYGSGGGGRGNHYGSGGGHHGDTGSGEAQRYDNRERGRPNYRNDGPHRGRGRGGRSYDDRSRSREFGRGGGRGRGDVKSADRIEWEQRGFKVKTNLYPLTFKSDGNHEFIMYHIQIFNAHRVKVKDSDGNVVKDENGQIKLQFCVGGRGRKFFKEGDPQTSEEIDEFQKKNRSSVLSRRILLKLQQQRKDQKLPNFITDGTSLAYSAKELFDHSQAQNLEDVKDTQVGHYGSADDGTSIVSQDRHLPASFTFEVCVRGECDDNDPDAEWIRNRWFAVNLIHAGNVNFSVVKNMVQKNIEESTIQQKVSAAINMALRNAMMSTMVSFGRSPRMFLFNTADEHERSRISDLMPVVSNDNCRPLVGLVQAALVNRIGNPFVATDLGLQWVHPAKGKNNEPIPLLQVANNGGAMICGVRIHNVNDVIPFELRKEVEKELRKMTFDVRYPKFKLKFKDGTEKVKKIVRKDLRVIRYDEKDPQCIAWAADDLAEYHFLSQDEKPQTVDHYLEERYGIKLKYPKMPLIRVSKKEYFALEFLFQSLSPLQNVNTDMMVSTALKFSTTFAATERVDRISELMRFQDAPLNTKQTEFLDLLNIQRSDQPIRLQAKILEQPELSFQSGVHTHAEDGSWDIKDKKFAVASELQSFAIVDLVNATNGPNVFTLVTKLFQQCQIHGMMIQKCCSTLIRDRQSLDRLVAKTHSEVLPGPDGLHPLFAEAVGRAKTFFLRDLNNRRNDPCFQTLVKYVDGEVYRCMTMPLFADKIDVPFENEYRPGFWISTRAGTQTLALKKYRVYHPETNEDPRVVESHSFRLDARGVPNAFVEGDWRRASSRFDVVYDTIDVETNYWLDADLIDKTPCVIRTQNRNNENCSFVNNLVGIIFPENGITPDSELWPTHHFHNPADTNQTLKARMKYRFKGEVIDVYDVGHDQDCSMMERIFVTIINSEARIFIEKEVAHLSPCHVVGVSRVECPSLIIVYARDENTEKYNIGKMFANAVHGVQSQVIVHTKYMKQEGKSAQYCSNVALKLNSKLSNKFSSGCAWKTHVRNPAVAGGLPWLHEAPTLVLGLSAAKKAGQESKMVVAAFCCLDEDGVRMAQEMRVANFSPVIPQVVIKSVAKSLILHFAYYNGMPKRVLVYRSGGHDGQFITFLAEEMGAIRETFKALIPTECQNPKCQNLGCHLCTPPITFIVAQTMHGIKVVPDRKPPTKKKNVPSGTCVDDDVQDENGVKITLLENGAMQTVVGSSDNGQSEVYESGSNFSFLLTAQGGLLGTSKPVFYRVLLNENYYYVNAPGTTELTKDKLTKLTYCMSFQYGSATKAPRLIPVLKYGSRLAKNALGYIDYFFHQNSPLRLVPDVAENSTLYVQRNDGNPSILKAFSQLSLRPHLAA